MVTVLERFCCAGELFVYVTIVFPSLQVFTFSVGMTRSQNIIVKDSVCSQVFYTFMSLG